MRDALEESYYPTKPTSPSSPPTSSSSTASVKEFRLTRLGVGMITTLLVLLTLACVRPSYIFTTKEDGSKKFNYALCGFLSLLAGVIAWQLPKMFLNTTCD